MQATHCPLLIPYSPHRLQAFPDDERLDGAQLQPLERVLHHETVLPRVLRDLVEVLLQQLLLLSTTRVGERGAGGMWGWG